MNTYHPLKAVTAFQQNLQTVTNVLYPRPALDSLAEERHEPVGTDLEECHKNDQRAEKSLLRGKTERAGLVQPGVQIASGKPYCGLPILKGSL